MTAAGGGVTLARMQRNGPRLPLVEMATADERQRAVAEEIVAARNVPGTPLLAAFNPLLHSPEAARRVASLGAFCRFQTRLPDDVRETAILSVAGALGAEYERAHHEPLARRSGVGEEQLRALRQGRLDGPPLAPLPSLAARMSREVAMAGGDTNRLMAECRATFGDGGTVELLVLAGYYSMLAAIQRVIGITVEDDPAP